MGSNDSLNLESFENLGILMNEDDEVETEDLDYLEAMAEAVYNLKSERNPGTNEKKFEFSKQLNSVKHSENNFGDEIQKMINYNQSIYNSSKIFPGIYDTNDQNIDTMRSFWNQSNVDSQNLTQNPEDFMEINDPNHLIVVLMFLILKWLDPRDTIKLKSLEIRI